jgi:hypothetical protein
VAQSSPQGKARRVGGREGGREERVEGDSRVGRGLQLQVATGGGGAGAVVVAQPSPIGVCSGCSERRARGAEVRSDGRRERRAEVGGGGREGESWLAPWEVAGGEGAALCRRRGRDLRRSLRERREATDLR